MQEMKSKRDRGIVWARCDAAPQSSALALLRYHLGFAAHHLARARQSMGGEEVEPAEYGHCHVVPTLSGSAFAGATHAGSACLFAQAEEAPPMLAMPDVFPLAAAYC